MTLIFLITVINACTITAIDIFVTEMKTPWVEAHGVWKKRNKIA
jgi:hypothetical protein